MNDDISEEYDARAARHKSHPIQPATYVAAASVGLTLAFGGIKLYDRFDNLLLDVLARVGVVEATLAAKQLAHDDIRDEFRAHVALDLQVRRDATRALMLAERLQSSADARPDPYTGSDAERDKRKITDSIDRLESRVEKLERVKQ